MKIPSISHLMRAIALVAIAIAISSFTSHGQAQHRVLVIPHAEGSISPTLAKHTDDVQVQLAQQGHNTWNLQSASSDFELSHSAAASQLSESDIDAWLAQSQSAVRHLARADYEAARQDLLQAQKVSEAAAEELNREVARAKQVLDTCLYMVRALIETGNMPEAEVQARKCRRLVPKIEASEFQHTPEVQTLLKKVDAKLKKEGHGNLRVTSAPSGCMVRINGIAQTATPFAVDNLAGGTYRVQVECQQGARGRVHRLDVLSGDNTLHIDVPFERVIRTLPILSLIYADLASRRQRMFDALKIGKVLSVSEYVLVSEDPSGGFRHDRVSADGQTVVASVIGKDASAIAKALSEEKAINLITGQPISKWTTGVTENSAEQIDSENSPSAPPVRSTKAFRRSKLFAVGLVLTAVGIAGIATGFALHNRQVGFGRNYQIVPPSLGGPDGFLVRQEKWIDARPPLFIAGAAGAAFLTVGLLTVIPRANHIPWWSIVMGIVGAGTVGVGAYMLAVKGNAKDTSGMPLCEDIATTQSECVDSDKYTNIGALMMMAGAPLLSVPLYYIFKHGPIEDAKIAVAPSPNGLSLNLTGRF